LAVYEAKHARIKVHKAFSGKKSGKGTALKFLDRTIRSPVEG
jgi:phosphotransferase system IIA component